MKKDYYMILGVSKESTLAEIKTAYRKLAFKFHPDKNPGDLFFENMFREINEAHENLSKLHSKVIHESTINERSTFKQKSNPNPTNQSQNTTQVINTIISNLRNLESQTRNKTKSQIKTEVIYKYLDQVLSNEILGLYGSIPIEKRNDFIFNILPLLRFCDKQVRGNYLMILTRIIGPDNRLISEIDQKVRSYVKSQKILDIKAKFSEYLWVLVLLFLAVLIYYGSTNEPDSSSPKESRKIIVDKEPEVKKNFSMWSGNYLNTGDSPYNGFFGEGVYDKSIQSKITIYNGQKADVIVCLTQNAPPYRTIRNEYIRAGESFEMTSVPNGVYYLKSFFGNGWNPNALYLGKIKGFFEANTGFSKSDNVSDLLRMVHDDNGYSIVEITLYPVSGGNMESKNINANEFFGK
jgi:hypothetical protein